MYRYKITYTGHEAVSKGDSAEDAFYNYCQRSFSGYFPRVAFGSRLELVDSNTRGQEWAHFWNENEGCRIIVVRKS